VFDAGLLKAAIYFEVAFILFEAAYIISARRA
jgi:hypothetical protein